MHDRGILMSKQVPCICISVPKVCCLDIVLTVHSRYLELFDLTPCFRKKNPGGATCIFDNHFIKGLLVNQVILRQFNLLYSKTSCEKL